MKPEIVCEDAVLKKMIEDHYEGNKAAQTFFRMCPKTQWPLIVDHAAIRCREIERRAEPFIARGFICRDEVIEFPQQGWWAKVYRKARCPALFIDQAYLRENDHLLRLWAERFGEDRLHHIAVRVLDIERAIATLKEEGVAFSGDIVGGPKTRLRQIFTMAEERDNTAFTVLELIERNGYDGFYPEQADGLMHASLRTSPQSPST